MALSDNARRMTSWYVEMIYKIGVPIALAGLYFFKTSFTTHEDHKAVISRVLRLETAIEIMIEANKTNDRQDARIHDFEQRIRYLEFEVRSATAAHRK
jgi:hypothetical protein